LFDHVDGSPQVIRLRAPFSPTDGLIYSLVRTMFNAFIQIGKRAGVN
jgi:hypothetical protein